VPTANEVCKLARSFSQEALETLVKMMRNAKLRGAVRIKAAFLRSEISISANAAPPKPQHACPKGEHWVLQPKYTAYWECVSNKPLPPPK